MSAAQRQLLLYFYSMKEITIKIKDSKFKFFMELIHNFDFVKVKNESDDEPSKEEILEGIRRGLQEVKLIEEGKMKSRPAKEFIRELQG